MGLHDGHRQRRREQFLQQGLDGLAPHEVLELLLFYAIPRKDTNELAHRLIRRFGSLSAVLEAPIEELRQIEGMGENAAAFLKLVPAVNHYARQNRCPDRIVSSVEEAGAYFQKLLSGREQELLYQMCLDGKGKVLSCHCISRGSTEAAAVSTRQVVSDALRAGASAVLLAHNHPSGIALPSEQDAAVTQLIRQALQSVDVTLIDHLIVADEDYVSLRQSGLIVF